MQKMKVIKRPLFEDSNPKQRMCIEAFFDPKIREIYYGGAKMCGKSYLGAFLFIMQAIRYPETHYFIARRRITDLSKFLIPSLKEVGKNYGVSNLFHVNLQRNTVEFTNGSKIFLLEAAYLPSDPLYARYGSMQITQGWIEEAGEVDLEAKVNLQASIGRWKNKEYDIPIKLLLTCNPANNFIYDVHRAFIRGELDPDTIFITALPTDNPYCTGEYFENLRRSLPEQIARRLLQGLWDFENTSNLYSYELVNQAFTKSAVQTRNRRKVIAVDVAHYGADRCVAWLYEGDGSTGGHFKILLDETETNLQQLVQRIHTWCNEYGINKMNVIFDAIGVGSYLKDFLPSATPFHSGRASRKTFGYKTELLYTNARVECMFLLAKLFETENISIEASEKQQRSLERELMTIEIIETKEDKMLDCTHKDEIKNKIGHSPDYLDSMYMCMYKFMQTNVPLPTMVRW